MTDCSRKAVTVCPSVSTIITINNFRSCATCQRTISSSTPQTLLPDIKSKRKYIVAQQPTQVTPVQTNPQQAIRKPSHSGVKLCQSEPASEIVPEVTGKNAAPAKPVRVQKQVRPAVVRKQKIKTAPKAKIKSATPATKALPNKASSAAPKQAATVIRGSGRKAGRSYRRRRRGGSFRCRGDLACRDVVCFAARYPVRR